MKRLIIGLIAIVAFATSNQVVAQKTVDTTSTETIRAAENKTEIFEIEHKGIKYYILNGIWHTKMKNNRFVLRNAPKGAKISFKPQGGTYVKMHGKKYYRCKGIFYKELKDSIYEVVRI